MITLSIPITFGLGTTLGYTMDVYARADASTFLGGSGTSASAVSNFSSTLAWGGITGVFDANGDPVAGYTATSRSGFDYSVAAVPTPSTAALLPVGLGIVAAVRRRTGNRG